MLKVYVLIFGLIALVPQKDPSGKITSLTALVLATPTGTTYSWNAPFPTHHPERSIYFLNTPPPLPVLHLANHQIRLTAPAVAAPGEISLPVGLRAMDLGKVFEAAGYTPAQVPKVRDECRSIDLLRPCNDSQGRNLLAATVTFNGDWLVKEVELNYELEPVTTPIDTSQYSFLRIDPPPGTLIPASMQLAGALLFEGNLTTQSDLNLQEGPTSYNNLPRGNCPSSLGGSQCIFITIGNHPLSSIPCTDITQFDRVDHHFDRIFELLDYSASPPTLPRRFLPYVLWRDQRAIDILCPGGFIGYPPAIKCPSPLIYQ